MAGAAAIVEPVGGLVLGAVLVAALVRLGREAAHRGLLWPVSVGFLLRLGVMLTAHLLSASAGEHGLMFLDDQTYLHAGTALASAWGSGHFPNPEAYNYAGTYQFGLPALIGLVGLLVGGSVLAVKLVDVVLGTATVLIVGLLARRLVGSQATLRATWMAALMPTLVWWSAPMIKECLATFLLAVALLAASWLPRPRGAAGLVVADVALFLTRSAASVAVAIGVLAGTVAWLMRRSGGIAWRRVAVWGGAGILIVAVVLIAISAGHPSDLTSTYSATIQRMFHRYEGGSLATLPANVVKSLVTPLPWAFDPATRDWDRGLYPGMWALFFLYPTAARGLWRVRARPEGAAVVATIVALLVLNAATSGFVFRQRSVIEPLILLLAVEGMSSWRQLVAWGAGGVAVSGVVAAVNTGSPTVTIAILAGAVALVVASRWAPAGDLRVETVDEPGEEYTSAPVFAGWLRGPRVTAVSEWVLSRSVYRRLAILPPRVVVSALVIVLMAAAGGSVYATQSTNSKTTPSPAHVVTQYGGRSCPPGSPSPEPPFVWCRWILAARGKPTVALIGDGTVLALDYGMEEVASRRAWGYVQAGQAGCSVLPLRFPSDPSVSQDVAMARRCVSGIPRVIAEVTTRVHPDIWLISDRWMLYPLQQRDGHILKPGDPRRTRIVAHALRALLRKLTSASAKVIFVTMPPPGPPPDCASDPSSHACTSSAYAIGGDTWTIDAQRLVQRVAAPMRGSVSVVNVNDIYCPDHGHCPATIDGHLVRFDGVRNTLYMSRRVAPAIINRAVRAGLTRGCSAPRTRPRPASCR